MNARLARLALALYPLAYRRRYGEEMEALLEDAGATPSAVLDLFRGALRARLRPEPAVLALVGREERLRRGLVAVLVCWALFAVAGLALYKTVEGRPFEGAPGIPGALGALHLVIQILAAIGGAAVLLGLCSGLARASRCAVVLVTAMAGITVLTAAYLVVLITAAPDLAGEPNGPFGSPDVAVSLALQLALMVGVAAPAAVAAVRARRVAEG